MSSEVSRNLNSVRARPAILAAIVNGLLVLIVPLVLILLSTPGSNSGTLVRPVPPSAFGKVTKRVAEAVLLLVPFSPFALAAFLRTHEHAKRVLNKQGRGLQGVTEAGALGLFVPLLILTPAIVTRPTHPDAVPSVMAYCGGGVIIGLSLGLILWLTGTLTLRVASKWSRVEPGECLGEPSEGTQA